MNIRFALPIALLALQRDRLHCPVVGRVMPSVAAVSSTRWTTASLALYGFALTGMTL